MTKAITNQPSLHATEEEFVISLLPRVCRSQKINWIKYTCAAERPMEDKFFPRGSSIQHMVMKCHLRLGTIALSFQIRLEYKKKGFDKEVDQMYLTALNERPHRISIEITDHNRETGRKLIRITDITSRHKNEASYKLLKQLILELWESAQRCNVCEKTTQLDSLKSLNVLLKKHQRFF